MRRAITRTATGWARALGVGAVLVGAACTGAPDKPDRPEPADTDTDADTDADTDTDTDTDLPDTGDSGTHPRSPALVFSGERPRNVLMLSIDTLRRGDMGRYSGLDTTPFLDGLAAGGVALDDHAACSSWTFPGILCALSGQNPEEFGFVPRILGGELSVEIPDGTALLPTWLGDSGYSSTLVASNVYFEPADGVGVGARYARNLVLPGLPADGVVDRALAMVDDAEFDATQPWLLHLHFLDPHAPYRPPDAYLSELEGRSEVPYDLGTDEGTRALAADWATLDGPTRDEVLAQLGIRYRGELRFTDDILALLWSELEARGLLDDTLVVIWSDHGEQFFEQGSLGHAGDLYAETTDAIAYFWAPNLVPAAWTEPTTHADIVPTVMDALGLPAVPGATGLVAGMAPSDRPRFQALAPVRGGPLQAVQVEDKRLVYWWTGTKRVFARGTEPRETGITYDPADPDVVALWALLTPEVERLQALLPEQTPVEPGP